MKIRVTFRHLPSSEALKNHVEEKVLKFSKFLAKPIDVHIILSVEKIRQIAELNIMSKHFSANAIEESSDMYTAIDKATAKMEAQLRRHKEKVKNHRVENKVYETLAELH